MSRARCSTSCGRSRRRSARWASRATIVRTDVTQGSSFTFLLYGLPNGHLDAIIEADALGQRRTGAASAVATKYLARTDSEVLAVFGAGWQAESQVETVARVLPLAGADRFAAKR